jgi:hypothetical protein
MGICQDAQKPKRCLTLADQVEKDETKAGISTALPGISAVAVE